MITTHTSVGYKKMQERAPSNKYSTIIVVSRRYTLALLCLTNLAEVNSVTGLRMSLDTIQQQGY